MSNSSVCVKQQVVIVPCEPTPNHILQLSALDSQIYFRFTAGSLRVYKLPPNGVDRVAITENVKKALGRVLVPYYPLAGRVRERADGSGLEVDCRAQGMLFIEAVSTSTVSELVEMDERREFLSLHVADVLVGAPPFVMQLTWLSDGGATLAVGLSHCLVDGTGLVQVLGAFAQLARGFEDLSLKPTWSRHRLGPVLTESTRDSSVLLSRHPEFKTVTDMSGLTSRYAQEQLIPTSVVFDKNMLNELKKSTKSTPTSFDVLSAHVWRSWVRSLNLASTQIVKLVFPVNIRQLVNPVIPDGYYGNAFVLTCVETSVGEVIGKGLGYTVELLMAAKKRVDDGYVREVVELVSWIRFCVDSVCTLVMTSWSRLGLGLGTGTDFGLGNPIHLAPLSPNRNCRLVPVLSAPTSLNVNLVIPSSAVNQYLYFLGNISSKM